MKSLLAFVLALCWMPAIACVHSVTSTTDYVEVCKASDACRRLDYTDIPNGSRAKKDEAVRSYMQSFLDVVINLNDPEFDLDPDAAQNPDCENFYWGDTTGAKKISLEATHLVARDCVIDAVVWDEVSATYVLTIRRAESCQ